MTNLMSFSICKFLFYSVYLFLFNSKIKVQISRAVSFEYLISCLPLYMDNVINNLYLHTCLTSWTVWKHMCFSSIFFSFGKLTSRNRCFKSLHDIKHTLWNMKLIKNTSSAFSLIILLIYFWKYYNFTVYIDNNRSGMLSTLVIANPRYRSTHSLIQFVFKLWLENSFSKCYKYENV